MRPEGRNVRWAEWLVAAALFFAVVGGNWAAFNRFGSDMPDWDQWDAEAAHLITPFFSDGPFLPHLLEAHNEHRVVLTKLQNLAVLLIGGQWDARVESVCNALLHGAIALGFWAMARRWLDRRWHAPLFLVIGLLYGLPLAWQNVIGGFHSQQYWLVGLSLVAIVATPFHPAWSSRWCVGVAAAIAALGSMGSGFMAALVVGGVVVWRWLRRQSNARTAVPTLAIMAVIVWIGLATRVERDYHAHLKAKTVSDFCLSVVRSLAWPVQQHDWIATLTWGPWFILTGSLVWRAGTRTESTAALETRAPVTLFALGGWVFVQLLATAYARGAGAGYPAPRYMDTLIFATAVNAGALCWLLSWIFRPQSVQPGLRAARIGLVVLAVAWLLVISFGGYHLCLTNVHDDLPRARRYYDATEQHVRAFVTRNDLEELIEPIPYPDAHALADRLSPSAIRTVLPESVRAPLPLHAGERSGFPETFVSPRSHDQPAASGLPVGLTPLVAQPFWSSFHQSAGASDQPPHFDSMPLTTTVKGWLRFDVAGEVDGTDNALELRDPHTGATLARIVTAGARTDAWQAFYVRAPHQPFVLHAHHRKSQAGFAFGTPIEVSSVSLAAKWLVRHALLLVGVSLLTAAFGSLWLRWSERASPERELT